ncbi:MAG: hypothetical protein PVF74_08105 [Anaerolineales bacterium]
MIVAEPDRARSLSLTCDECFAVLEYLAMEAMNGAKEMLLKRALQKHLEMCPDCREHHLERLRLLEERMGSTRGRV